MSLPMKGIHRAAALCGFFAFTLLSAGGVSADVQGELNQMFGNMTNYTAPGAYETARRGVLSGGSLKTRNKITDTPLVNFQPPSMQAGCGGIDMFAGSFSYINADQFVQTLRSVASNAGGYAFSLALDSMCSQCMQKISDLQKKVQDLNSLASNSCQMAQGLVTNTKSAFKDLMDKNDSTHSISEGQTDVFGAMSPANNSENKSAREKLAAANKLVQCKDKGNVLWCAMQKNSVSTYFSYADRSIQEAIMTLTGTIIIGEDAQAADNKGTSAQIIPYAPNPDFTLKILLSGTLSTPVKILKCDDDEFCSNPVPTDATIKGLAQQIEEAYNLPGGIIDKYALGTGTLNDTEKAIVASSHGTAMGPMVVNIVQKSPDIARTFVSQYSPLLAASMVNDLMVQMVGAAQTAVSTSLFPQAPEVQKLIETANARINREYMAVMTEKGGGLNGMIANYNQILTAIPPVYPVAVKSAQNRAH